MTVGLTETAWYRQLFENSQMPQLLIHPLTGRIVDANPAAQQFYGYTITELRRLHIADINQLPQDQIQKEMGRAKSQKSSFFLFPHRMKDGRIRQVEVWSTPLEMPGQSLLHSVIQDATTKMEALREKREALSRLETISTNLPGLVYQFLRKRDGSYHIPSMQGPSKDLFGFTSEEMEVDAAKAFTHIHPDDLQPLIDSIEYSAATLSKWSFTFRILHPQNGQIWLKAMSNPRALPGGDVLWNGICMDLTPQMNAEERLGMYRTILMRSSDSVIIFDQAGHILELNNAALQLLGLSAKSCKTKNLSEVLGEPATQDLLRSLAQKGEFREESSLTLKGGIKRIVDAAAFSLTPAGHSTGWLVAVLRDVTEQRRKGEVQAGQRKQEALGVLAGGVAHDFNNLLTSILGNADLARLKASDSPETLALLDRITGAAEGARDLCAKMLAFSGRGNLIATSVQMDQLLLDFQDTLRASLQQRARLELHINAPEEGFAPLNADLQQIHQALIQLLLNASEAMPPKDPSLEPLVSILLSHTSFSRDALLGFNGTPDLQPGHYLCLEVRDNGEGMTDDTLNRLFEPFFSTRFTGRGLGLCAVLGIVKAHSGGIRVQSGFSQGTSITLIFPYSSSGLKNFNSTHKEVTP